MITKICGIKDKKTLLCCNENKVNFYGMIFYNKSPRNITIDEAVKLQNLSKKLKINGVGVFVNEDIFDLRNYINVLELNYIQLHGDEDDGYLKEIKKFNININIIKKISIREKKDLKKIYKFKNADFFLLDYKPKANELPGGNAKSFDWEIIENFEINKPWFMSGGINLGNIDLIKRKINPFGVDISSGAEKELGIKDNHIINNIMGIINNA